MNIDSKNRLAVALHYDQKGAPRVVAKGKGTIGEKIIEIAKENDIPIQENEVLERVLSEFTEMKILMRQQSEESQRKIDELQGKFEGR